MNEELTKRRFALLVLTGSAILAYIYWMPLFESKAYLLHDDLVHYDNIELWINQHQPLWGKIVSTNNIHNSMRLSRYLILKIYSLFSSSFEGFNKLWFYIITVVAILANTYAFQSFLRISRKEKKLDTADRLLAYAASIAYTFSFWTIYTTTKHALFTGWVVFPVVFYFGLLISTARDFIHIVKYSLYFTIFAFFFLITPHTLIYALITIYIFILFSENLQNIFKRIIIFTSIFILLNLYWILPFIEYSTKVSILLPYNKVLLETLNLLSRNIRAINLFTFYDPWMHFYVVTYYFNFDILKISLLIQTIINSFTIFYIMFYLHKYPVNEQRVILAITVLAAISLVIKGGMVFEQDLYKALVSMPAIGWVFRVPYRAELLFFPSILIAILYVFKRNRWLSLILLIGILITNMLYMIPWRWLYLETFYQNPPANPQFQVSHIYSIAHGAPISRVFTVNPYDYSLGRCTWCIDLHFKDLRQIPSYYPVLSSPVPIYDYVFANNFGKMLYLWFWYAPSSAAELATLLSKLGINTYLIRKDFTMYKYASKRWNEYASYLQDTMNCTKFEDKYNALLVCGTGTGLIDITNNIVFSTNLIHLLSLNYTFIFLNYLNKNEKDLINYTPVLVLDYQNTWLDYLPLLLDDEDAVIVKPAKYTNIRRASVGWAYANEFYSSLTFNKPANIIMNTKSWFGDYGYGIAFTWARNAVLRIHFKLEKGDNYKILCRLFENSRGGTIELSLDGRLININTKSMINRFVWKDLGVIRLREGDHTLILKNINGFNAINIIILIPESAFSRLKAEAAKLLQNKELIYVLEAEQDLYYERAMVIDDPAASGYGELVFTGKGKAWQQVDIAVDGEYQLALKGRGLFKLRVGNTTETLILNNSIAYTRALHLRKGVYNIEVQPLAYESLLYNPSFEKVSQGLPEGWSTPASHVFNVSIDKGYSGNYSLRVSTSSDKKATWSWIRSKPIRVKPGEKYLVITHMKTWNTRSSHIVIEGYLANKKKWIQLAQVPPGSKGTGTQGWREFWRVVKIPPGVTMIRIVLNAGWVLDKSKGKAITWFDDIWVSRLDESPLLDYVRIYSLRPAAIAGNGRAAYIYSYKHDSVTKWVINIKAKKPFMLILREAYDPLWEATIYKNGEIAEKAHSMPVYGVINGFWINQTGNLTIVIRYVPQELFKLGLRISLLSFALCLFYLLWSWRRSKNDEWTLWLEDKLRSVTRRLTGFYRRPVTTV